YNVSRPPSFCSALRDNTTIAVAWRLFSRHVAYFHRNQVISRRKLRFPSCLIAVVTLIFVPVVTYNVAFIAQLVRAPP
ncbi:hypothetical protein, partial [Salmonella enterica]|uniref:hypothetical protein n=1 Tax=Salmonella enterica TaxID=28901 RepID=UPI0038B70BBC